MFYENKSIKDCIFSIVNPLDCFRDLISPITIPLQALEDGKHLLSYLKFTEEAQRVPHDKRYRWIFMIKEDDRLEAVACR